MKKITILFIISILFQIPLLSQNKANAQYTVKGKIIEGNSNSPLEYATIAIYNDIDSSLITGDISSPDGSFSIKVNAPRIKANISFMGFTSKEFRASASATNIIDLGTVELYEDNTEIGEVLVRAEKSELEFKLDKRVFNVGKDLTNAGGSALEVLNNVPSVNVNIEGQISLRGSTSVTILINGTPSVLANGNSLGTIPSDKIERVELVTNPSAKYDSEGTSGIINIILAKDEKKGINGALSLNTGIPTNHSAGFSINRRSEKFNLFAQLGYGKRAFLSESSGENTSTSQSGTSTLSYNGTGIKQEEFYNIILGTDYHINEYNTLSLQGHFAYELENEGSDTDNTTSDSEGITESSRRTEETTAINPKWEYTLDYKRSYPENEERELLASLQSSFFGKTQDSKYSNTNLFDNTIIPDKLNNKDFGETEHMLKLDYVHPIGENQIIEGGLKLEYNINYENNSISDWQDMQWQSNLAQSMHFNLSENINALYTTYSYENDKFGVKGGLRAENTRINSYLEESDETSERSFTNLFPTLHLTFHLSQKIALQAGYSRRISRPHGEELNPFVSIRNPWSVHSGNPEIDPEYSNSFDLTSIFNIPKGSVNTTLYYRKTFNMITDIISYSGLSQLTRPENIGYSHNAGLELNSKLELFNSFSVLLDANFRAYNRIAEYDGISYDYNSSSWSTRLTLKTKLPMDIDFEIRARYRSGYKDIQRVYADEAYADLGLKKKLFKGRAVINLSVNDVFASRRRESSYISEEFSSYSSFARDTRRIILGFSFGFGKGNAMEYSGQKHF